MRVGVIDVLRLGVEGARSNPENFSGFRRRLSQKRTVASCLAGKRLAHLFKEIRKLRIWVWQSCLDQLPGSFSRTGPQASCRAPAYDHRGIEVHAICRLPVSPLDTQVCHTVSRRPFLVSMHGGIVPAAPESPVLFGLRAVCCYTDW